MDRVGVSLMMAKLSYAASTGRLAQADVAEARHRLGLELDSRDDPEGRARLIVFCDRLSAARGDQNALEAVAGELRDALRLWSRPDPVDLHRRDIHG